MGYVIFTVIGFMVALCCICYHYDKKAWNNSVCSKCEKGFYKSFAMDSQGGVGYKCTECDNSIWLSWFTPPRKGIKK